MPHSLPTSLILHNALLASRLSKRVGNHLSVHGISLTEYLVMHHLDASPHKAVPRSELAEHMGMSASGVTRLVAPMIKNHIVEKLSNPRDARQSLVKLSDTGQQLFIDASVSFEHIATASLQRLSAEQQQALAAIYAQWM